MFRTFLKVFRHNFPGKRNKINHNEESPPRMRHPETKTESGRLHDHDRSIGSAMLELCQTAVQAS